MEKSIISCLGGKAAIGITLIGITLGAVGCSNQTASNPTRKYNPQINLNIFPDPWSSPYFEEQKSAGGHGVIWYPLFPPVD